jgi:hypothetical protein
MNAEQVEFGGRYILKPSRMLDRPNPITVTVVERCHNLKYFRVRGPRSRRLRVFRCCARCVFSSRTRRMVMRCAAIRISGVRRPALSGRRSRFPRCRLGSVDRPSPMHSFGSVGSALVQRETGRTGARPRLRHAVVVRAGQQDRAGKPHQHSLKSLAQADPDYPAVAVRAWRGQGDLHVAQESAEAGTD